MTLTVLAARVAEIRTTLTRLDPPPPATTTSTTRTVDPRAVAGAAGPAGTSADDFAALLTAATAPGSTRGAGTSAGAAVPAAAGATGTAGRVDAAPGEATAADFVAAARQYLGVPYVWGGESLAEGGLDCSGLVQRAMKDVGVDVPRTARQQMSVGTEVPSLAQAVPGDLIVTRGGGHIMIYLGDNRVLHAPRPGEQVQVRELFETDTDITTIRRVLASAPAGQPDDDGTGAAAGRAAGGTDLVDAAARAAVTGAG